jgi:hypothetical protein
MKLLPKRGSAAGAEAQNGPTDDRPVAGFPALGAPREQPGKPRMAAIDRLRKRPTPKAPERVSFAASGRQRRGRTFGVELDGSVIRVAEVVDETLVAFTSFQGTSQANAIKQFLATKPSGTIVVAWSPDTLHVQQVELPHLPKEALRAGLLDAVEGDLPFPANLATLAARVIECDDGSQTAVVAAVEHEAAGTVWSSLTTSDVHLVPGPLVLEHDGLFLGMRNESAELTLVSGGRVVAMRPLLAGGLRKLFSQLDDDLGRAAERFHAVARGGARNDPAASTVIEAYAAGLGEEVRRSVDYWARQGHSVGSEVLVHGPGIMVPNLAGRLLDAALFAKPAPVGGLDVGALARSDRPLSFTAIAAAQFDVDAQFLSSVPDPRQAELARLRREKTKRSKRLAAMLGLVVVSGVILHLPVRSAESGAQAAEVELAEVTAEADGLGAVRTLNRKVKDATEAYRKLVAAEPNWRTLIEQVVTWTPAQGATVRGITILINNQDRIATLEFAASIPGRDFRATVSEWLKEFERRGAVNPWSGSFTRSCVDVPVGQTAAQPAGGALEGCPSGKIPEVTASFRVPFALTGDFLSDRTMPDGSPVRPVAAAPAAASPAPASPAPAPAPAAGGGAGRSTAT